MFNKGNIAYNRKHPKTNKSHDEIIDDIVKKIESEGNRYIILGYKPERKNELVYPDIIEIQGNNIKIICHEVELCGWSKKWLFNKKFKDIKKWWDEIKWYIFSHYERQKKYTKAWVKRKRLIK